MVNGYGKIVIVHTALYHSRVSMIMNYNIYSLSWLLGYGITATPDTM